MSQESLALYNAQRKHQVEDGNFSEIGLMDGVTKLKGIFDDHYSKGEKDNANVTAQFHKKVFLVDTVPTYNKKVTTLTITAGTFTMIKDDKDENGVPVIWLK